MFHAPCGWTCAHVKVQVWPAPFGRDLTKEEAYIQQLDASTGASLQLTVLIAEGRIWTMVAGGGASVVYSDAIAAHGFAHELANYGEYSGAPTEGQTYEYAKTIRECSHAVGSHTCSDESRSRFDDSRRNSS